MGMAVINEHAPPKQLVEEDNEKVIIEPASKNISKLEFSYLGKLIDSNTLEVQVSDIEEYLHDKHHKKQKGDLVPFIIYLNSSFVKNVRTNRKHRKIKRLGGYFFILL